MKLIMYVGVDEPVMVIEKETDLYPALDFIQTKMIELEEGGNENAGKCANFINVLMDEAEKKGFGNCDDVENVEWS